MTNTERQAKIVWFALRTGAKDVAERFLKEAGWKINVAIQLYEADCRQRHKESVQ